MGRGLMTSGAMLLLTTLSLWIADAVGSISEKFDASWSALTLKAGVILLGAGFLLHILSPVRRGLGRGHCAVCGRPIDRGHVYCHDHMQETVNAYRDQAHDKMLRPGRRSSSSS
jgi:hypothetical protein